MGRKKMVYKKVVSQDLAQQLRGAIRDSGKSQYQLAKETGLPQGQISRFLAGADILLSRAGPLAAAVGLRLR